MTYLKPQPQTSSRVIFDSFQFANNKNDDIILYLFTCKFFEFWLVTSLPLFVFSKKNANQFEFFHQSESRPRLSTEFVLSYEFSLSQLHRLSCNLSSSTSLPISWSHKNTKVSKEKNENDCETGIRYDMGCFKHFADFDYIWKSNGWQAAKDLKRKSNTKSKLNLSIKDQKMIKLNL